MEKIVKIINIHQKTNDFLFWASKSPQERIDALETLRQNYINLKYHVQPRFQRVYTIIERKKS